MKQPPKPKNIFYQKKTDLKDSQYNKVSMSSTLNLLNAFERSVKCESDTLFINNWLARLVDPGRTTMLPSMVLEPGNLFSNPMVEMPTVKGNVKHLRGFKNYAPNEDAKQKILKIVDLYESRKIPQFEQANQVIRNLTDKAMVANGKADKSYNQLVARYDHAVSLKGRLEREAAAKQAKREATKETAYDVSLLLFKKADPATKHNDTVGDVDVYVPSATKEQKQEIKKAAAKRRYKDFDQWWFGNIDLNLTVSEYNWLKEKEHHLIKRANARDTKAEGRELDREFKR